MSDTDAPELTVAEMMARVRQHLAARRDEDNYVNAASHPFGTAPHLKSRLNGHAKSNSAHRANGHAPRAGKFRGFKPSVDWYQMLEGLRIAEQYCLTGKYIPELKRWPSPVRFGIQLFARAMLLATKFITNRQRAFNHCTLGALGNIHGVLHHYEKVQRENLQRLETCLSDQEEQINRLHEEIACLRHELTQSRRDLAGQDRRINLLLEEARRRMPQPFDREQVQSIASEHDHACDRLQAHVQEFLAGSRAGQKETRRPYLEVLRQAGAGTPERPVLDLGCGAGAWLELLQEEGLTARGVEPNRFLAEDCRRHGLALEEADPLSYLRGLAADSVGAVTGLNFLERLPLDRLLAVLDETVRVLQDGGVALFETPNPRNPTVGGYSFHLDPTRTRPLPGQLACFLLEFRGLCRVEVLNPAALAGPGSPGTNPPPIYAVVGWKA